MGKWDQASSGYEDMFNQPNTQNGIAKLIGKINQKESLQTAAASVTAANGVFWVADFAGVIGDLYLVLAALVPGAGESMVYDVQRAPAGGAVFASILTGTFTLNLAAMPSPDDLISLYGLIDRTKNKFLPGDMFTVVRTYTAGGTPAPITFNKVVAEPSIRLWK